MKRCKQIRENKLKLPKCGESLRDLLNPLNQVPLVRDFVFFLGIIHLILD